MRGTKSARSTGGRAVTSWTSWPAGSLTPPEAAATQRKFRALSRAAACYLRTVGWEGEVQFDLAAAEAAADGSVRVELIENALEYNW